MTRKTCMAAFSKEHLRVITPVAEDHRANKFQRNTDFAYPVQMSRTKRRRKGIILNHKNTPGNTNPVQIGLRRHYKETGLIYLKQSCKGIGISNSIQIPRKKLDNIFNTLERN